MGCFDSEPYRLWPLLKQHKHKTAAKLLQSSRLIYS
jgi:hypothetical protein